MWQAVFLVITSSPDLWNSIFFLVVTIPSQGGVCIYLCNFLLLFVILLNSNMLLQFNSLYYTGMGDFAKFLLIYIVRDCFFIFKSLNVLLVMAFINKLERDI